MLYNVYQLTPEEAGKRMLARSLCEQDTATFIEQLHLKGYFSTAYADVARNVVNYTELPRGNALHIGIRNKM